MEFCRFPPLPGPHPQKRLKSCHPKLHHDLDCKPSKFAIIRLHAKYKTLLNPEIHPEMHPKSPSKTEIQKKSEKYKNHPIFVYFSYFFCISVLKGIWGVFRGVFWGSEGFCILYGDV